MTSGTKAFGDRAEAIVAGMLEREGFTVLDRNWRCRAGEIDLVVSRAGVCVFVEVRARRSNLMGGAVESVGPRKKARLLAAVAAYEMEHPDLPDGRRIDVVTLDREGGHLVIRRFENAIEGE